MPEQILQQPKKSDGITEKKRVFLENLSSKEGILKEFKIAREFIEENCGIKLTNIELVGLRHITEEVVKQFVIDEVEHVGERERFIPPEEINARFLLEYYGVNNEILKSWGYELNIDQPSKYNLELGDKDNRIKKEWFRKKQQELHDQPPDR
ncbi:MAG: hypothetical protein Q7K35_05130 [bacterium]|nr:hypothetical protein [bacterium]